MGRRERDRIFSDSSSRLDSFRQDANGESSMDVHDSSTAEDHSDAPGPLGSPLPLTTSSVFVSPPSSSSASEKGISASEDPKRSSGVSSFSPPNDGSGFAPPLFAVEESGTRFAPNSSIVGSNLISSSSSSRRMTSIDRLSDIRRPSPFGLDSTDGDDNEAEMELYLPDDYFLGSPEVAPVLLGYARTVLVLVLLDMVACLLLTFWGLWWNLVKFPIAVFGYYVVKKLRRRWTLWYFYANCFDLVLSVVEILIGFASPSYSIPLVLLLLCDLGLQIALVWFVWRLYREMSPQNTTSSFSRLNDDRL